MCLRPSLTPRPCLFRLYRKPHVLSYLVSLMPAALVILNKTLQVPTVTGLSIQQTLPQGSFLGGRIYSMLASEKFPESRSKSFVARNRKIRPRA